MEEEEEQSTKWRFKGSEELIKASAFTIKGVVSRLSKNLSEDDNRPVISLGHGDPSASRCFLTTPIAEDAIVEAVRSAQFNSYAPNNISRDLPYKLSPDDVYLTVGTMHAIQIILPVLAYPGANILLPKPGYPMYEAHAALSHLEVRHFDLLPEKGWEVDLDGLRALANDKTVAMVIINPGNPCGNVFTYEHLQKIVDCIKSCVNVTSGPATFIQGAIPHFFANTTEDFFLKTLNILREAADFCYDRLEEIPCITCPHKAEGSMFVMVKLNLSLLEGINDDMELCVKLAKEESVIVLPGVALGLKNWLRITFATEPSSLEDGLGRINAFCLRHAKKD